MECAGMVTVHEPLREPSMSSTLSETASGCVIELTASGESAHNTCAEAGWHRP